MDDWIAFLNVCLMIIVIVFLNVFLNVRQKIVVIVFLNVFLMIATTAILKVC